MWECCDYLEDLNPKIYIFLADHSNFRSLAVNTK
jgi:hypothetical protein